MRSLALYLLLAATTALAFELKRVTVAQLEQEVNALQGKPDAKVAGQLADLQLAERLSATKFTQLQTQIPGTDARQALLILADTSAFLNLPSAEVPQTPAPDFPTQQRILTQTIHYVARTVRQLPNFSASRVTTRFEDMPQAAMQGVITHMSYSYQPFHLAGTFNSPVVFRDGQEVTGVAGKRNEPAMNGLTTKGEFGPILFTVCWISRTTRSNGTTGNKLWTKRSRSLPSVYRVSSLTTRWELAVCPMILPAPRNNFPAITGRLRLIRPTGRSSGLWCRQT